MYRLNRYIFMVSSMQVSFGIAMLTHQNKEQTAYYIHDSDRSSKAHEACQQILSMQNDIATKNIPLPGLLRDDLGKLVLACVARQKMLDKNSNRQFTGDVTLLADGHLLSTWTRVKKELCNEVFQCQSDV